MKKQRYYYRKKVKEIGYHLFLLPIYIYRGVISPYFPMTCRHIPTCSRYAIEAVRTHGILYGSWLTLRRLLCCHPWGTSGYDPVPPKKQTFE